MNSQGKKIGIMGGTFNPIHNGHLILAQNAFNYYHLDEIIFIPAGNPWMKNKSDIIDSSIRVEMVKKAIENNPYFSLSTIETDREGETYSYVTMQKLNKLHPENEYYYIMGADSVLHLNEWKHPEILLKSCHILAAVREDCDKKQLSMHISLLEEKYDARIYILPCDRFDISSTQIRKMIQDKMSVRYLIPDSVLEYIKENHLYEGTSNNG